MNKFLLTLLVTFEQESAIQKLFGRYGWEYSRITVEKLGNKLTDISKHALSEPSITLQQSLPSPRTSLEVSDNAPASSSVLSDLSGNSAGEKYDIEAGATVVVIRTDDLNVRMTCDRISTGVTLCDDNEKDPDDNENVNIDDGHDDYVDGNDTDKILSSQNIDVIEECVITRPARLDNAIEKHDGTFNEEYTCITEEKDCDKTKVSGKRKRTVPSELGIGSAKIRKTVYVSAAELGKNVDNTDFIVKELSDIDRELLDDSVPIIEKLSDIDHVSETVSSGKPDIEIDHFYPDDLDNTRYSAKLSLYYCLDCHFTFPEEKFYTLHKRDGKCVFPCQFCEKEFKFQNFSEYQEHLKQHRGKVGCDGAPCKTTCFKCPICAKTSSNVFNMVRHVDNIHTLQKNVNRCQQCHLKFTTKQALIAHKKTHLCICPDCGKMYSSPSSLNVHIQKMHSDEKFYCKVEHCSYVANCKQALDFHANSHSGNKPYSCKHCGNSYRRKDSCSRHQLVCINGVSCDKCSTKFGSKSALSAHVRAKHSNERFQCLCGSEFSYRANLLRHWKTSGHTVPEKEYEVEAEFIALPLQ